MLSAGAGRGRGWMKLEKNTEPCRPGDDFKKLEPPSPKLPVQKSNCYDDLIKQFECLDSEDDGILLNEKLKHIRSIFMNTCETEEEITKAVVAIHQKCLTNEEFMKKFVSFITSAFFYNMQNSKAHLNWRTIVQKCFFNHLQANFENRELLREKKPEIFYNSLELHMNFFKKCRIIHPYGYPTVEAAAVSGFLHTLLEHREPTDIKMFFYMVCENREMLIKLYNTNELMELLNKLKKTLVCDDKLPTNQKLLLFFSWDLIRHKFDLSSEEIKFYMDHMEEEYIKEILVKCNYILGKTNAEIVNPSRTEHKHHSPLQEQQSSKDSFKLSSTVHGCSNLQEDSASDQYLYSGSSVMNTVCDNEEVSGMSRVTNFQVGVSNYDLKSPKNDSWEYADSGKTNRTDYSNMNRQKGISNEKVLDKHKQVEKVGRPILGVGARLNRNC